MTRTTVAALALGSALTLAACTSNSSSGASSPTSTTPPATTPAATTAAPSGSAAPSAAPSGSTAASGSSAPSGSVSASPSAAVTTPSVPPTVTSPGSTPTATTTSAAAGASTQCLNANLKVGLVGGDAAAGSLYTSLVFTNTGTATCTLAGHPGVSYVAGDDGHQVGASATRVGTVIHTVTLAPGGSAAALLHETNYADFDQTVCKPVTVRGLRVYPPNSTRAVFLPRVGKECSATVLPDPAVSIGVVVAGRSATA